MNIEISIKGKNVLTATLLIAIMTLSSFAIFSPVTAAEPTLMDPLTIDKWVNQITGPPPVYIPHVIKDPQGKGIDIPIHRNNG